MQTSKESLAAGLRYLQEVQYWVSGDVPGAISNDGPTPEQIRTYFLALIVEATELMNEFNWKPWKQKKQIDTDKVKEEFADILAFLGLIMVYMRQLLITPEDLVQAYQQKTEKNIRRFETGNDEEGYGGVSASSSTN